MSTVFVSYRRQTAAGEARALFNDLVARLGQSAVFMDVDSISLGRDFRSELNKTLTACDLMLVVIDKDWAAAKDESGRVRLENAGDFVRMEIEAALKRDIVVTPVLVKGARMPAAEELPAEIRDLAYRNGFELSHNRWESDVRELIRRLNFDVPEQGRQVETDRRPIAPGEAGGGSVPTGAKPRVDRVRGIIDKTSSVPAKQRASMLRLLAIGAFGVGALGIMAWVANGWSGGQHTSTRGSDSPAVISGGNVTIGPASSAGPSVPAPEIGVTPSATAKTEGTRSPAIVSGGNAVISTPNNSVTPKAP
jgi:hypothetical protein